MRRSGFALLFLAGCTSGTGEFLCVDECKVILAPGEIGQIETMFTADGPWTGDYTFSVELRDAVGLTAEVTPATSNIDGLEPVEVKVTVEVASDTEPNSEAFALFAEHNDKNIVRETNLYVEITGD